MHRTLVLNLQPAAGHASLRASQNRRATSGRRLPQPCVHHVRKRSRSTWYVCRPSRRRVARVFPLSKGCACLQSSNLHLSICVYLSFAPTCPRRFVCTRVHHRFRMESLWERGDSFLLLTL